MKVEILAEFSDHVRSYKAGEVCEMDDGQATRLSPMKLVRIIPDEPEAATLEPPETAAMPRARKRG